MNFQKTLFQSVGLSLLLFIAFFFNTENALAQKKKVAAIVIGGGGGTAVGANIFDLKDLNTMLENTGYKGFSGTSVALGANLNFIYKKLIMVSVIRKFPLENINTAGYRNKLNITYGLFDLGYIVYQYKNLTMYPMIGIGDGKINLSIYKKEPDSISTFSGVFNGTKKGMTVSNFNSILLDFAAGMNYRFGTGFNVGVQAGYLFSPFKADWFIDNTIFSDGPKTALSGPYINLLIGKYLF